MNDLKKKFANLKKNLESVAFFATKDGFQREIHSNVVQSLVLVEQIEQEVENLINPDNQTEIVIDEKYFIEQEIKKVKRRVPRWFDNPTQYNSQILMAFLELYETNDKVTDIMLYEKCRHIKTFFNNYAQMKDFGEKNHGKVFDEVNGFITLWEPVKDFILNLYRRKKVIEY